MTRGTYTRVLLATGLAFCTLPALGVNPATATHVVSPADEPGPAAAEVEPAQPATPPADAAPAEEAPAQEAPAEEAPAQEAPAAEAPAQEAPAQEAPAQEAPAQEAPAQPAPAAPSQEAPAPPAPAAPAEEEAPADQQKGLTSTVVDHAATLVQVAGESTQPPTGGDVE
ncbi:hypothetical protein [Sporichthya polymorpha]|uniref:hypothetical protein n=1 Tax=Sporichthya polymorpha TaxID=35751 RepID=UPI000368CE57|nr:hypothetical protein [Sporichthya polymorpha]